MEDDSQFARNPSTVACVTSLDHVEAVLTLSTPERASEGVREPEVWVFSCRTLSLHSGPCSGSAPVFGLQVG